MLPPWATQPDPEDAADDNAGLEPPEGPQDDHRLLAAASYLTFMIGFGLVGPVVIYAWKRRSSPFVSDHALQAALLHVVWLPAAAIVLPVFWALGALLHELSPFSKLHGLTMLVGVLLLATGEVVAHVIGIVRALRGKPFQVPVLGTWLERQLRAR